MLDISEYPINAEFNILGEAEIVAPELDYFNGTGITGGADASIKGLEVVIHGRAYVIPAKDLPGALTQAMTEAVEGEIEKEIF